MKDQPSEQDYTNLLNRLKAKDPHFNETVEIGRLLLINRDDWTTAQLERYNHIKSIVKTTNP